MLETTDLATPWKILIVDDEPEIHTLTKAVLKDLVFDGRPVEFLSAFSGAETKDIMARQSDIALVLLDVVMEQEDSGLEVVRHIRDDLANRNVRIILRTGQPGQAPERSIIVNYEINDYKEKVDLTSAKLFISVVSSLRNYRDLQSIEKSKAELERNQEGLGKVIQSSSEVFRLHTFEELNPELTEKLFSLVEQFPDAMLVTCGNDGTCATVVAGRGRWSDVHEDSLDDVLPVDIADFLRQAKEHKGIVFRDEGFAGAVDSGAGVSFILWVDTDGRLSEEDRRLYEVFFNNMNIVAKRISLERDILETQTEIIRLLGNVIENRSKETANHVIRVAEYAAIIARKKGFSESEITDLKNAVSLHDTGKIGIPDHILLKPGALSDEEFEVMKTHTEMGHLILKGATSKLMQMAAVIALEHHERWDGSGYPRGLAGERIHLLGRLTSIADVFDALSTDRIYRKAWPLEKTIKFVEDKKGEHFDPELVNLFLEEKDAIKDIMVRYAD